MRACLIFFVSNKSDFSFHCHRLEAMSLNCCLEQVFIVLPFLSYLQKIQELKKEKENLALNYEQEEECLTNDLSRKLDQVRLQFLLSR